MECDEMVIPHTHTQEQLDTNLRSPRIIVQDLVRCQLGEHEQICLAVYCNKAREKHLAIIIYVSCVHMLI